MNSFIPTDSDLGAPAAVPTDAGPVLGRITKLMGERFGDQYPRVRFVTPHGSAFDGAGIIWLKLRRLDAQELELLTEYEREVMAEGREPYNGEVKP